MPAPDRSPDDLRRVLETEADALGAVAQGPAREGVARAVRRQRMVRVAMAAPLVVLVLVAGVAFAATTEDGTTAEVAVGGEAADDVRTTTTALPEGPVTTGVPICGKLDVAPGGDTAPILPYGPDGLEDDGGVPATTTSIVDGETADPCATTTTSLPTCPTGTIVEPAPDCVPVTTTWITPGDATTEVPATTVPLDDPAATAPTTDTTAPGTAGEPLMCGTISPSGWPTTAAPNPQITECLVSAFQGGEPAWMVVVSYAIPDSNGGDPAYRHEITYTVVDVGVVEVRTDWSSATDGPVGLVTVERCTGLTGSMYPEVSGCAPA